MDRLPGHAATSRLSKGVVSGSVRGCFLAPLLGLHRYWIRQVAYEFNVRLEERLNERTRITRELHDTLLQSFQGVAGDIWGLAQPFR